MLRWRAELDAALAPLARRGWKQVDPALRDVLRLGAYQLRRLDRVPAHAAVGTSVELAGEALGPKARGFANAVLRALARGAKEAERRAPCDEADALAREASHPAWLVRRWLERFGAEETRALLAWNNRRPRLILQPARRDAAALEAAWGAAGIAVEPAPFGAGLATDRTHPAELPGYEEGHFVVQDGAQALVTWFADVPAHALVYDACAAPGGKAIALGRLARLVVAADRSARRVRRLVENLRRAGSGREHAVVADAEAAALREADVVLLDAPCTATGTFARHPDARWRVRPEAIAALAERQARLLDAAAPVVRRGGLLVYATCSLEPEENEARVEAFLRTTPTFRREPPEGYPAALLSDAGDLRVLPQRHGVDGAYAARLRRVA